MSDFFDFLSSMSDVVMATTAVVAARKAFTWFDNKALDNADDFFREIHKFHKRYSVMTQYAYKAYQILQNHYGVQSESIMASEKGTRLDVESFRLKVMEEGDYFISSFMLMDAMDVKLREQSAKKVSALMTAHGRFMRDIIDFLEDLNRTLKNQKAGYNPIILHNGSTRYTAIIISANEASGIAFELKDINFKELYLLNDKKYQNHFLLRPFLDAYKSVSKRLKKLFRKVS